MCMYISVYGYVHMNAGAGAGVKGGCKLPSMGAGN